MYAILKRFIRRHPKLARIARYMLLLVKKTQPSIPKNNQEISLWLKIKRRVTLTLKNKPAEMAKEAMEQNQWGKAVKYWQLALSPNWHKISFRPPRQMETAEWVVSLSVAKRMLHLDQYRQAIDNYEKARPLRPKNEIRIAVFSAVAGGYDSVRPPEYLDHGHDYILFTDSPVPNMRYLQVRPLEYLNVDPVRSARFIKTHPHFFLKDYDIAVWVDANVLIRGDIRPIIDSFITSGRAVGAIPHPVRKSVFEEGKACIQAGKDNEEIICDQMKSYQLQKFDCDDLIESNFMMFNLSDKRLTNFFEIWWRQIDTFSKRDQLSLNYALQKSGIKWHKLFEEPYSLRNHSLFSWAYHDGGAGPSNTLVNALKESTIDPYARKPFSEVRAEIISRHRERAIDIIVCVHNALDDVQRCLESIKTFRTITNQRLIIVDDGSSQLTAEFLSAYKQTNSNVTLHRNNVALGYTKAANKGLSLSSAEFMVLLNSDTVVTDGWLEKLADAVFSTPGAGIVGPMSNAASHQSLPEHKSSQNQTAINSLPPGVSAEEMNRYCEKWSMAEVLPRVPLVHGFCFGITRDVLNKIGSFDEINFPKGYGEENDYCFRAVDAGFSLVVATHTYIFHVKSKSYTGPERIALMKAGSESLRRLHGEVRVKRAVKSMQCNPIFVRMREKAWTLYRNGENNMDVLNMT